RNSIKVYLRIKPDLKPRILGPPQDELFTVKSPTQLVTKFSKDSVSHEFQFTKVFKSDSTQEDVYSQSVHGLMADFINGQNCLLFAYGTSSAGKTYTIQGPWCCRRVWMDSFFFFFFFFSGTPQEPGVLPRAISTLFNTIIGRTSKVCRFKPYMFCRVQLLDETSVKEELAFKQKIMTWSIGSEQSQSSQSYTHTSELSSDSQSVSTFSSLLTHNISANMFREMQSRLTDLRSEIDAEKDTVFSVWVSFAEVYNENVFDLLEPISSRGHKRTNLTLGQDGTSNIYIKGLRHVWVTSGEEAYQVLLYGQHNLKFAPTGLNSVSSRSHCIFTIKLLKYKACELPDSISISMFSFCDLAGAERLKNTQNVGERLRESQNINTSLLVLGRCLTTIR
ncbi:hypothetical protein L9F63_027074, partial [Diploptera punctata]